MPNDDNANAVISVLQKDKIPPKTFPTTGQDASPSGLQNILKGYQCGTVYKPTSSRPRRRPRSRSTCARASTPPDTLVNATTKDDKTGDDIKSVYTPPTWVTVRQHGRTPSSRTAPAKASDLCAGNLASACQSAGIS